MASVADSASPNSFLEGSTHLKDVPSNALSSDSIPVIDFSALNHPDQRSKTIHDLAKACEEWGFFILVNHGMPEELMDSTFRGLKEFVNLPNEVKKQYKGKTPLNPISFRTFNSAESNMEDTLCSNNLILHVHPNFHCPDKPHFLRDVVLEYTERTRKITRELLKAITEGLELEQGYVAETLGLDSSFQMYVANYYPPSLQPDQESDITPHVDYGLITLLIHNGVSGLQIKNKGQWFDVDSPKNAILVNINSQLESFTNGRYKSVLHRVVMNETRERMSTVSIYGPSQKANFGPAIALVERDNGIAKYPSINQNYENWLLSRAYTGTKDSIFSQG